MTEQKSLTSYLAEIFIASGLQNITSDENAKSVRCPIGEILGFSQGFYHLKFIYYSPKDSIYVERDKYNEIIFPESFDIKKYLYFKNNGVYKISFEKLFKKVINPLNKKVKTIKLVSGSNIKRFIQDTLLISEDVFISAFKDAENINRKRNSYATSIENYLSGLEAAKYGRVIKLKTTHIEKGELAFSINRLNLRTKKSKEDFEKYLDNNDLESIESLVELMIRKEVFSNDFLRKINDYFIKEKLKDIIELGKQILLLNKKDIKNDEESEIIFQLGLQNNCQLENIWQKYFEKNLLYLIFSYKKIFPKIELKDIDGDKKYPDFIGINHYNGLDVIEIKTHLTKALVWDSSHKNFYFSPEMSKSIVQTTNYLDSIIRERFKKSGDRNKITNFIEEENLYHPKGIIIISSSKKLTSKKGENEKLNRDFTKLRNTLHNIEILTFDEIISIADEYIKNIIN